MGALGDFYTVTTMVTSAALLALAAIVFRFRKRQAYYLYWAGTCLLLGVLWLSIALVGRVVEDPSIALALAKVALTAGASTAACFLAFALSFVGTMGRHRAAMVLAAAGGLVLVGLFWGTDLMVSGVERTAYGVRMPIAGPLMPLHGVYTSVNGIAVVVYFALRYRKATGRTRLQLGYLLLAMAIMVMGAVGTLLPTMDRDSLWALVPSALMILAPSLVTYAIVRHQLWDIRTVIHRTAMWAGASLVVLAPVYLFLRYFSDRLASRGAAVAVVAAVLLLGAFTVYFRAVQPWLDDRFARRKHDVNRTVDRFNRDVVHLKGVRELADLVTSTIARTVYATDVAVRAAGAADGGTAAPDELCSELDEPTCDWLVALDRAVDLSALDGYRRVAASVRATLEQSPRLAKVAVLLPLVHEGKLLALVTLAEKQNLKAYTRDDFELLERIRPAATVALANALHYDQLQELTESLEQRVDQRTVELRDANERLRELDRQRSKFFANITHELRTPLTLILGPLEDLLMAQKGPARGAPDLEDLEVMHRNALRLLRQINALLDLAKHDAGQLRLKPEIMGLDELVETVVRTFRPIARRKGVALELEPLAAGSSDRMSGDSEKLTLVLNNLLANALKFTSSGGRVCVSVLADEHRLTVKVTDTGIGIPADQLERIFDRFAQVDGSTTRRYEGAGIGLALVKELVGLHQGSVAVVSEEGEGSEFSVDLPRELVPEPEQIDRRRVDLPTGVQRRAEDRDPVAWVATAMDGEAWISVDGPTSDGPQSQSSERRARLVVAEDNPDMRSYLQRRLGEYFDVTPCADGLEALSACRERPPDLLLADVMMPGLSGLDLCARLRDDESTQGVPIVLLTARKGLERALEGFEVGADDYVTKPFNFRELLARVRVQLKLVEMGRELARHQKGEILNLVAAGLAHEVRNPVNAILNAVRPLLDDEHLRADDAAAIEARAELLQAVFESAERIDKLCSDLLDVSRPQLDELSDWQVDEALSAALRLIKHKNGGQDIQVERRIEHSDPVFGRTAQLNQVLMNLLDNALRAAGPQGRVWVSTEQSAGEFLLCVEDSGDGVPVELAEKIFDPLFSTHVRQGAKGLGLHITRRIVEEHGGTVAVQSAKGGGARFVVALPLSVPGRASTVASEVS